MSEKLEIRDLVVRFYTYEGVVKALEGVDLLINEGETLGLVGETGSGKTVTGLSILRLIPTPGRIEGGEILFRGRTTAMSILNQDESDLRGIRGKDISIIFQEPSSALNPLYEVGDQIAEVLLQHRKKEFIRRALDGIEREITVHSDRSGFILITQRSIYRRMMEDPNALSLRILSRIPVARRYQRRLEKEVRKEVVNIIDQMGISDPERVAGMYPHELSGGMKQRIVIAIALACNPTLLIADEPTTSLDMTIQAQILNLIEVLKKEFGTSVLYITHDLGVIAEICDRVAVMYAGSIVEVADVFKIFKNPLHPYMKALLESIPRVGREFKSIRGTMPNLIDPPSGCRFHPRCSQAMELCSQVKPEVKEVTKDHYVACHLY